MTFNPNADISGSKAERRGGRGAVVGGGIAGVGGILALVFALLTGGSFDPNVIFGNQDQGSEAQATDGATCLTGVDANENDECRLAGAQILLDDFWSKHVKGYVSPTEVIYSGQTQSACGTADNQVGPFYCPTDQKLYVDPSFFQLMRQQFGASAGNLAQLYIVGHEWGHHIQNITGVFEEHPNDGTGAESNSVRTELQADCFAGGWLSQVTDTKGSDGKPLLEPITQDQLKDALNAAASVGDDNIQKRSGYVNPDSFTHGTSAERQKWFSTGYNEGINACDTFSGAL
ncbi:KPN_02809 family neutral zinc metallopeptidase [Microbacterium gorillae]|uniref:KPN_02809 family neutral zinc metallopeptidase n=1 Tax=Microbacterium gorillae TaxID=1231063 RepID=UPI00058CEFBB|nr:neutral zinc metallopeptidase [Microbacterium gorillae]